MVLIDASINNMRSRHKTDQVQNEKTVTSIRYERRERNGGGLANESLVERSLNESTRQEDNLKKMLCVLKVCKAENQVKLDKVDRLVGTYKRMWTRTFENVNFQSKVRLKENLDVNWVEEECNRILVENNCLVIEKEKLSLQIGKLRNEIKEMIGKDEENKSYFEDCLPLEFTSWSQISVFRAFSKTLDLGAPHLGPVEVRQTIDPLVTSKSNECLNNRVDGNISPKNTKKCTLLKTGIFKSQDRLKSEDNGIPRRGSNEVNVNGAGRLFPNVKFGSLLLRKGKGRSSKPDINSSKNDQSCLDASKISKMRLNSKEGILKQRGIDSGSFSRLRSREGSNVDPSHLESYFSPIKKADERRKNLVNHCILSRQKANQIMVKMDHLAQSRFGTAYADVTKYISDIDRHIETTEKRIKRRLKYCRQVLLLVLNIILCFKKAFQVLSFDRSKTNGENSEHLTMRSQKQHSVSNCHTLVDTSKLSEIHSKLNRLAHVVSEHTKKIVLEPFKIQVPVFSSKYDQYQTKETGPSIKLNHTNNLSEGLNTQENHSKMSISPQDLKNTNDASVTGADVSNFGNNEVKGKPHRDRRDGDDSKHKECIEKPRYKPAKKRIFDVNRI